MNHSSTSIPDVQRICAGMTPAAKVAQLIFPHLEGTTDPDGSQAEELLAELAEVPYGGYIVFRGDTRATPRLLDRLQRLAAVPLLIASDVEAGTGQQIKGATSFPSALAVAATGSPEHAYAMGRATAREARAVGINWAFAPVADVNTNPANPIINCRSFGDDPRRVGELAAAFVRGCQEHGLLATAKHFPGHGDTDRDSHLELPRVPADRQALEQIHLVPFRRCIAADVAAIMTAHLLVPALQPGEQVPATLSQAVMTGVLRDELGFKGLVVTDALNMGGVQGDDDGKTALAAVSAGCDALLMPTRPRQVHEYLLAALADGRLAPARLDASVQRILAAKARLGLLAGQPPATGAALPDPEAAAAARAIAADCLTLVRDRTALLPLDLAAPGVRLLLLDDHGGDGIAAPWLAEAGHRLPGRAVTIVHGDDGAAALDRWPAGAGVTICAVFSAVKAWKGRAGLAEPLLAGLNRLAERAGPLVVICFGSPYDAGSLPAVDTIMCGYSPHAETQRAAWLALGGEIPCRGNLPVTVSTPAS